jgi:hypothetical protein
MQFRLGSPTLQPENRKAVIKRNERLGRLAALASTILKNLPN